MPSAPPPVSETEGLAALRSYEILDTACETAFDNTAGLGGKNQVLHRAFRSP